jgi:catechol 2,3-dioxygenase-like lactoylglutathione lyase family enzyme
MALEMVVPLEVGIVCRDLPALRAFYEQGLGMQCISEIKVPADKAAESALAEQAYTVVRLQTSYGERIKLLSTGDAGLSAQAEPSYLLQRQGLAYLTFIVRDIDMAIADLQRSGARFMTGPQRVEVRSGVYLAFCRDPEGNVLELVQYRDIAQYRSDLAGEK